MPFQSANGNISKLAYDKSVEALEKANENFSRIDVLNQNPIDPSPGQMWIIDEVYEDLFLYSMSGTPGNPLDADKVDVIIRTESGSNYNPAQTFAKIDSTGEKADLRYAQDIDDGTRGDINIFPKINALDFDNYKYRFTFDMSLTSSQHATEALGFSLQTDDTVAQINKQNYIHVNVAKNDLSNFYFFIDKKENGTNTRLTGVSFPNSGYEGMTKVSIVLEKNNITVFFDNVEIKNHSFTVGADYYAGLKPSLYVQNRSATASTENRFSNLEIERLPR